MGMLRKFFYRKPPDGLFEISEKVYVFDCCFTTDILKDDEYNVYIGGIIIQLREHFPGASFMVFNFREGDNQSQISTILSHYDMIVMDYPRQYETVPLLTMEMIHHFLRSSESWLSLAPQNILLMHCERGGWPVLAFMLAALLIYRKQYTGELKTLDMIYKQAPRELLQLISPMNPLPSQLRYLQYISRRNVGSVWPPVDRVLTLDCIIIRVIPNSDGEGGFRPMFRIYGQDPFVASDRSPKVVFSTPKRSKAVRHYKQIDCELVKVDIHCIVKGDVLLECVSLDKDLEHEKMMFRIMFNTAFIRSNILMLNRDEIDVLWDSKYQFPKDFRAEVLFTEMNNLTSRTSVDIPALEDKEGLPMEAFAKVREIFSSFDWLDPKSDVALSVLQQISATNPISETLEAMPSLSVDTTCLRQILSAEKADQREKTEASENTNSSNSVRGKVEPQELLVTLETPTKSEIISPRIPHSPQCHPISSGNFLQGSPVSIARYNSAPSSMGITTLLHDHAVNDNVEVTHKIIKSSSPVSHVSKLGLVQIPPPSVRPPPVASFSIASTSIESSYSPPPPPPPPRPQTHFYESPPPPISRSSFADTVKNSVLPPPPPPLPSSLSRSHVVPIVERSMLTPPPPPLPRSTTTMCPSSLDMERKTSIAPPPPPPPKGVLSKASQQAPPVPPPPTTFSTSSGGCSPKSHTCSNWNVPPTPLSASNAKGPTQLRTSSRNHGQGKRTSLKPYHWLKLSRAMQGSLWAEAQKSDEASKPPEFDMSELENLFSAATPSSGLGSIRGKSNHSASGRKSDKVQVIDLRRAYNCEIMLTKVKIPLPDLMSSVLALDESALDVDQVDNLVKFCPTKEETELLKGFKGDQENLGKCEQFFLELMKVPRVESKLRVFSFKIQFRTQVSDLRHSLNVVNSAAEEIKGSVKLKRIMQTILSLGNALNHGTARGSAVGFRLDSLLKLTDTKARNNKMTLMHYLCKVLAEKLPELLDFAKDLVHLEASERIQLKLLAEEMQAISKGLEKVVQELTASENDGPVSVKFCKILKEFLGFAEGEVRSLASLYSGVGRNADALAYYFGEDPARCPFEQVVSTLLNFVRMFVRAHGENCKQIELEKKKAQKEAESEKTKTAACKKESANPTEVEKKKAHEKMKGTSAASKEPARLPT